MKLDGAQIALILLMGSDRQESGVLPSSAETGLALQRENMTVKISSLQVAQQQSPVEATPEGWTLCMTKLHFTSQEMAGGRSIHT